MVVDVMAESIAAFRNPAVKNIEVGGAVSA